MSIKLMSLAWEVPLGTTPKIVLLALCDWADDKGGSCFPAMETIAKKASISARHAQRMVKELEEHGFVSCVGNATGGAPGMTKQFRINVRRLFEATQETGDILSGVTNEAGRVTNGAETGDTHVTQSTIDPSITTISSTRARKDDEPEWLPLEAWDEFEAMRKAKGSRTPYTPGARKLAIQTLAKLRDAGSNPAEVLEQSVLNGWSGLFAIKPQAAAMKPARGTGETAYQRSMRERMQVAAPLVAAKAPGASTNPLEMFDARPAAPRLG